MEEREGETIPAGVTDDDESEVPADEDDGGCPCEPEETSGGVADFGVVGDTAYERRRSRTFGVTDERDGVSSFDGVMARAAGPLSDVHAAAAAAGNAEARVEDKLATRAFREEDDNIGTATEEEDDDDAGADTVTEGAASEETRNLGRTDAV